MPTKTKMKAKKKIEAMPENTKERIVGAAIKLFANQGYERTSTKQICDDAKANVAALHYYFKSKENLYLSIINQFGTDSLGSALRTLSEVSDISELKTRLEMFLNEVFELCLPNLDLVIIVQNESQSLHPRSQEVVKATFLKMFEALVSFLNTASKKKLLSREIEPFFAAGALFSQLSQAIRGEPVSQKYFNQSLKDLNYRKKWIHSTVHMFLEGVTPRAI